MQSARLERSRMGREKRGEVWGWGEGCVWCVGVNEGSEVYAEKAAGI